MHQLDKIHQKQILKLMIGERFLVEKLFTYRKKENTPRSKINKFLATLKI